MSDAYEALMSMTDDQAATYSIDPSTEGHIVVGPDRFVTVPESLKRIGVQYDHKIETVTFDCPRYWDGHDMSQMHIYINFRAANGEIGGYIAQNISVDGDIMHFDWTITKDVTQAAGKIAFLVCVKKSDVEGNEENHWNSELCTDMYVSEGLESEPTLEDYDPIVITQLLTRMDRVELINVQAGEMHTLHQETLAAMKAAANSANSALASRAEVVLRADEIRNSYANAIKYRTSGKIIRVDDVSPVTHDVKTTVKNKNLIPCPFDEADSEKSGVTFITQSDGSLRIFGTPTINVSFNFTMQYKKRLMVEKGKTYTLSVKSTLSDARGYVFIQNWANGEVVDNKSVRNGQLTFVASENGSVQLGIVLLAGQIFNEAVLIQLEEGETQTTYTPYVDPTTMSVTRCGKNVFALAGKTQTLNGITCTVNEDGTVVVDGTAEKATFFGLGNFYPVAGARYRLSGCPSGGEFDTYILYIHNNTTGADIYDLGSGKAFTGSAGDQGVTLAVYAGTTVSNLTFYPMVTLGDEPEDFEPYTGETFTPSSDGIVEGIAAISPTMVTYANTPGVIIDIEYNKDLNAIFDEINALLELLVNGGA